jgi:hypothetical protein
MQKIDMKKYRINRTIIFATISVQIIYVCGLCAMGVISIKLLLDDLNRYNYSIKYPNGPFHYSINLLSYLPIIMFLIIFTISFIYLGINLLMNWINTILVISPEEIVFTVPGYELRTSWNNIIAIETRSVGIFGMTNDYLLLNSPGKVKRKWWFRYYDIFGTISNREIPLNYFSNWRTSGLFEDFQKYAPQLFKGIKS